MLLEIMRILLEFVNLTAVMQMFDSHENVSETARMNTDAARMRGGRCFQKP
jgi:hypothetical protein